MNAANKLLDKYAEVCGVSTDSDLAARLRVSKQAVSGWRNAKSHPNAAAIETMCKATGEKSQHWMPLIEAERSRTPDDRKAWLRLAQLAASVAVIYLFSRLNVHHDVLASVAFAARNPGTLYIMSTFVFGTIIAAILRKHRNRNEVSMDV